MKVRICYTVELTDRYRRALNQRYGLPGLATRKDIKSHFEQNGASLDDDIETEFDEDEERK